MLNNIIFSGIFVFFSLDPARALIGQKPMFYQSVNIEKACFIVFRPITSTS